MDEKDSTKLESRIAKVKERSPTLTLPSPLIKGEGKREPHGSVLGGLKGRRSYSIVAGVCIL
jgi:hypothetical protein